MCVCYWRVDANERRRERAWSRHHSIVYVAYVIYAHTDIRVPYLLKEHRLVIETVKRQERRHLVGGQRRLLRYELVDAVLQHGVGLHELGYDFALDGRLHGGACGALAGLEALEHRGVCYVCARGRVLCMCKWREVLYLSLKDKIIKVQRHVGVEGAVVDEGARGRVLQQAVV